MPVGTKRKRPDNGLAAGERLKRDKLAGSELYSQWGWVTRISEPSQITFEHRLAAYGFLDNIGKPLCKNKYSEVCEPERKKQKMEVAQDNTSKLAEGEDAEDIIIISSDDDEPPVCSKKRCKENPHCLNYLGQVKLENEDGALQAFLDLSSLGPSPLCTAREPDLPVGLKNLGATCYANAFIQVWFQDRAFRDGVYRCKPSQEEGKDIEDSPIFQLQVTFAALQESTQNVFNPVKLVESLQLRASEQQDAQEFSKLFMSHLATEFEKQAVPSLKTLLSDQFEGKQTYGTMCRKCRHRSERDTDFLELEINLENNGKLEERIEALLQSEELTDDNKYHCGQCGSLQDATRYTKLRRLPPVRPNLILNLPDHDIQTHLRLDRRKSKQAILFPQILNMTPFVETDDPESSGSVQVPTKRRHDEAEGNNQGSDLIYELRGVLLHKGPSAYHGHYEAQVFDVTTKQFYQFNDETVTPIASLQSKKGSDKELEDEKPSATANKKRKTYTRKKVRVDDSDAEANVPSNGKQYHESNYISSKHAYMLIYARRDAELSDASLHQVPEPPRPARARVADLNKSHDDACATFVVREKKLIDAFDDMRRKKQSIYRHWEVGDLTDESAVVGRQALEGWLAKDIEKFEKKKHVKDGSIGPDISQDPSREPTPDLTGQDHSQRSESPCDPLDLLAPLREQAVQRGHRLDNSTIVCPHGALDPRKAGEMKRIRKSSLEVIRADTGCFFDPELTVEDACEFCVKDIFMDKRYALDHPIQVSNFDELCETENDTQGAWISRTWIKDWRQAKPKMHITGEEDPPPDAPKYTSHVKCAHGQLSLLLSSRRRITGEACAFLQDLFPTFSPVPDDVPECEACKEELQLSKGTKQELKRRTENEKAKLRSLVSSIGLAIEPEIIPGVTHAIVPTDFVRRWRAWINRPQEKPRPGPVDNTWLICEHNCLVIDPNLPQDLGTGILLVGLSEWEALQDLYGGGPLIALKGVMPDTQDSETAVSVVHDLDVCHKCRNDRLNNFETAIITIRILTDDEANPTPESYEGSSKDTTPRPSITNGVNGSSGSNSKGRRDVARPARTSTRIRQSQRRIRLRDIMIQKSSTVKDIKIELHSELDIPTICQRLFFKGVELTDNLETAASLGIMANDTLDLREEKENDDALNSDAELEHRRERRDEGRAFGGTILSGDFSRKTTTPGDEEGTERQSSPEIALVSNSCPACTFINPVDLSFCTICDSPLDSV